MEVNAQAVINRLGTRIAQLEVDLAIANARLEEQSKNDPVPAENT